MLGAWATYTSAGVTTYARATGGVISSATADFIYQTATNISSVAGYSSTGLMQVDSTSTGNVIQTAGVPPPSWTPSK